MNPREYYHLKTASITEADVRLVAACMTDYVGEANAVRIETLAGRVGFHERQVRDILETLVIGDLDSRIRRSGNGARRC